MPDDLADFLLSLLMLRPLLPLLQDLAAAVDLAASGAKGKLAPMPVVVARGGRSEKANRDEETQLAGGSWQPGVNVTSVGLCHDNAVNCAWLFIALALLPEPSGNKRLVQLPLQRLSLGEACNVKQQMPFCQCAVLYLLLQACYCIAHQMPLLLLCLIMQIP